MKRYRPRLLDTLIARKLRSSGGILLHGARATGKTTTALQHSKSHVRLDKSESIRQLATISPASVMDGETPRLIDEWQLVPSIWNAVRAEIDERGQKGQFILTGSATPDVNATQHTGAGRFARLVLRPMSLFESADSSGVVDFASLFEPAGKRPPIQGLGGPDIPRYAELIVRGGWPALLRLSTEDARDALTDYIDHIAAVDLRCLAAPPNPQRMAALIRALARNVSTEATLEKLAAEAGLNGGALTAQTVRKYLDQLTSCFILDEVPAWNITIRSSIRLRVKPKWHFVDPSLATAALRVSPSALLDDLETMGFLFESMAVRDLRIYAEVADASIFHYRDSNDLEIDAIVERRDGSWLAIEVKLGGEKAIANAVANFTKLHNRLTPAKLAALRACCIITGGETSYTRPDGIHIIALGHLGINTAPSSAPQKKIKSKK